MNKVWIAILSASILILLFIDPSGVLSGLTNAANRAVKLSFELCAIYAIWIGIFTILEQTGVTKWLSKVLSPLINFIFGKKNLSDESRNYVCMSISANMLGMGGAATPLGIKAIESMNKDNPDKTTITYPMTMMIILSCTVLQFLPTSIMGLMSASGSKNPASIVFPSILASILSTLSGVIIVKLVHFFSTRRSARRQRKGEKKKNG